MTKKTAKQKTDELKRIDIPIEYLEKNEANPNEMGDAEFNMLHDNITKVGITDPILVRKLGKNKYRIVGGHHRMEVASLIGFDKIPCTVIDDPDFDEDQEKFQMIRHNVIRGKMDTGKFMKMYDELSKKYQADILKDSFGFTNDKEFNKLLKKTEDGLPEDIKKQFKEAKGEIKTIDDLAKVLNHLFTAYGDTLPYGYMVCDFGGKESIWIRMSGDTKNAMLSIGTKCIESKRSMDTMIGKIMQLIAKGKFNEQWDKIVNKTKEVELPSNFVGIPTEDNIENAEKETSG